MTARPGLTIHRDIEQGTPEWYAIRRGKLTASTMGVYLTTKPPSALDYACPECVQPAGDPCLSLGRKTPTTIKVPHSSRSEAAAANPLGLPHRVEVVDTDAGRTLLAALVAERLTDWEDPQFETGDMARGHQIEPIARDWYAAHKGVEVEEVGFMTWTFDDGTALGFSPDGLVGDHGLLEVKAPRAKRHVLTHVHQEVPAEHVAQCQTGMYVSGRQWCDYVSYVGGEPPFVKRLHADPAWFAAIEKAARQFEARAAEMQAAYRKATAGLPATDRLPDPYDVELRIA